MIEIGIWKRWREAREQPKETEIVSDSLLRALIGETKITAEEAMSIPTVAGCVGKIADTVASLEIKLYRRNGDAIEEMTDDKRTKLLNGDTGDTLDAFQMKRAMVKDMFLDKGGYAFVHKSNGEIVSLHYVEANRLAFTYDPNPIFKDYKIYCYGAYYEGWQWIKLLRNTRNGYSGESIVDESKTFFETAYASLLYEKNLVKTGGNKKGFLQSAKKLSTEAMEALKKAFKRMYSDSSENVIVLNDGLTFKESSNTSVELQLNENKKTNADEICKMFHVPPSIISGKAIEEDKKNYIEGAIIPILDRFATAINAVMLDEDEKNDMFFSFDTTDLVKGDIEKRFGAYKIAIDSGFMQIDEVREKEKLPAFGLDFIKLGLQDVLYSPSSKTVYTPNTDKTSKMGENPVKEEPEKKEGEEDAD